MPRLAAVLRLVLFSLLLLSHSPAVADERRGPVMVEEVVAVVDLRETRVLLFSDLENEARLSRARARGGKTLREPVTQRDLSQALDRLINQLVIVDEAARLQLFDPTRQDVDAGVAALRAAVGPEAFDTFISEFELEETVRDIVRRELRVSRYLDGRFRLASKPREADVTAFIASRKEYENRDPASVFAEARERLAKARFEQLASSFVTDIRRRARIRILHDPATPLGPTPLHGTAAVGEHGSAR